jgi:CheY-like chemotaxis protein
MAEISMIKLRVLVAEDEAMIALSLADLLEAEGYEVTLAGDGAEALDLARRLGTALDALVTDLNMPKMSGEDLIHTLRGERPGLPIVVVTGSPPWGGAAQLLRESGGYGPLALVSKPIDYAELLASLRRSIPPRRL